MTAQASLTYQVTVSSELQANQRYEHWLKPLLSDFEAADPNPQQLQNFQGHVTSLVLGSRELHDMQSDDFQGTCSRQHMRRHEDSKLALIYVMQGRVVSEYEGDVDTVARAGQLFLFDGARPNRIRFHQPRFVQINLPRAPLQAVLPDGTAPSQVHKALSRSSLTGLLSSHLGQFRDLSARLSMHERHGLLEATEALAVSVIQSACLDHQVHDGGNRYLGLYTAAQRHIRLHLSSACLNGDVIAGALGCSRATLYRAFAEQNASLAGQIRELRLQKLARLLQSPANMAPIAQLAHLCGLHDAPNLSRLFRQRFGVSPQEYRAAHRESARL